MKRLVIAVALAYHAMLNAAPSVPTGWRIPAEGDYSDDWVQYRELIPIPFHARGDFNGDGISDDAYILLRQDNKDQWGLFAFLSSGGQAGARVIRLRTKLEEAPAQWHAVVTVPPGKKETACGKGLMDCGKGDARHITLKTHAFEFLSLGKGGVTYYWHPQKKTFHWVTTSD